METRCVEWAFARDPNGYGRVRHEGKTVLAHRLAYCRAHRLRLSDIDGQVVRHRCDNPPCINHEHLVLGTHQDNTNDKRERGRMPIGNTHHNRKLSEVEVLFIARNYKARDPEYGGRALAARFNVSPQTICDIVNGRHFIKEAA